MFSAGASAHYAHNHTPGLRESKRPKGHKVQLALGREIEQLNEELVRERKETAKALARLHELENRFLALEANRDGWRARAESHARLIELLEERLGLIARQRSWEERREQVQESVTRLLAAGSK